MRNLRRLVWTLLCACLVALALSAVADEYARTASGWRHPSADADLNGDMVLGGIVSTHGEATLRGKGKGKGKGKAKATTSSGVTDLLPSDGTYCDFDGSCNPIAVEVLYYDVTAVTRMDDGDLLYRQMSTGGSSSISSLCFNLADETSTFEIHFDVVGGTGKFDGATGSTLLTGSASDVGTGIQSGIELEESGVVNLVE